MKTLLLMRHADSVKADIFAPDFYRSLSSLGVSQSEEAGNYLASIGGVEKICLSSSNRTMQTLENMLKNQSSDITLPAVSDKDKLPKELYHNDQGKFVKLIECNRLYRATYEDMFGMVRHQPNNKYSSMLVLAHNPYIYTTALEFSNKQDPLYEQLLMCTMLPATIVHLQFPDAESWDELLPKHGKIVSLFSPATDSEEVHY